MIRGLRETIAVAAVALMTVGVGIGLSAAGAGQAAERLRRRFGPLPSSALSRLYARTGTSYELW